MALAIRFDRLLRDGGVKDYAELARLGHVTRVRMSQIMGLLNLAPNIQEEILFLPKNVKGRDPISAREVIQMAMIEDWHGQLRKWVKFKNIRPERNTFVSTSSSAILQPRRHRLY